MNHLRHGLRIYRRPEEVARNPQDEKSRLEEAEERRKLRESQTQVDDEDMPSFLDLDTDLPGRIQIEHTYFASIPRILFLSNLHRTRSGYTLENS